MGLKTVLKNKSVYFDSNIFIYLLENNDIFKKPLSDIEQLIRQGEIEIWSNDLVYAELIPPHAKSKNTAAIKHIIDFLDCFNIASISKSIFIHAGILRGETGMKTPDALHIASAAALECNVFLTNDKGIETPDTLRKILLSDYTRH